MIFFLVMVSGSNPLGPCHKGYLVGLNSSVDKEMPKPKHKVQKSSPLTYFHMQSTTHAPPYSNLGGEARSSSTYFHTQSTDMHLHIYSNLGEEARSLWQFIYNGWMYYMHMQSMLATSMPSS